MKHQTEFIFVMMYNKNKTKCIKKLLRVGSSFQSFQETYSGIDSWKFWICWATQLDRLKKQGVNLIWSISKDSKSEPSSKMFFRAKTNRIICENYILSKNSLSTDLPPFYVKIDMIERSDMMLATQKGQTFFHSRISM